MRDLVKIVETMDILQPDGSRACTTYESPIGDGYQLIDPADLCAWKQIYQDNMSGKGTSFSERNSSLSCAGCSGFDKVCLNYIAYKREDAESKV